MKLGQVLNGYEVVTRPTNADAGKCLWAFAERDGERFFVKEFLTPKLPKPDSMGSVEEKKRRFEECDRFEERHLRIARMLPADGLHAGNLVVTAAFFAEGTRFYKVTRRIDPVGPEVLAGLDHGARLILVRTLADSLCALHGQGVVHGDLKPENVLPAFAGNGRTAVAKLIDFDDAYPAGEPPPRELVGGNPLYGAPEWLRYLRGDQLVGGDALTQAVDVFAFALLVHHYLYGALPGYGPEHDSPAAALLDGGALTWDPRADPALRALLASATDPDPAARPDVAAVAAGLAPSARPLLHSRLRINVRTTPRWSPAR